MEKIPATIYTIKVYTPPTWKLITKVYLIVTFIILFLDLTKSLWGHRQQNFHHASWILAAKGGHFFYIWKRLIVQLSYKAVSYKKACKRYIQIAWPSCSESFASAPTFAAHWSRLMLLNTVNDQIRAPALKLPSLISAHPKIREKK